jgi:integrase
MIHELVHITATIETYVVTIPYLKNHGKRHTFITHQVKGGADMYKTAKYVGHSSTQTTEAIYTHIKEREMGAPIPYGLNSKKGKGKKGNVVKLRKRAR